MAATRKKSPGSRTPDAIGLLKLDHEKVLGLLESLEKAGGDRRSKLLDRIDRELKIHTRIEEEVFYPAFRKAARTKDDQTMFYEAVSEHRMVDVALPEAREGENHEELKAKAKVLRELVEHHAEEEEKDMFPRARKAMDRAELRDLAEKMVQRRKELTGK